MTGRDVQPRDPVGRISTRVLDTSRGVPAPGVPVSLALRTEDGWTELAAAPTDADGQVANLLPDNVNHFVGTYRLRFDVSGYFATRSVVAFYPHIDVVFTVQEDEPHHVPLLVSPFGYSTYRAD